MTVTKTKVSLTLAVDLVATIDREAERSGATRSYLAEQWLRYGASRAAEASIDAATTAYYASLTGAAREEDIAIGRALGLAAKRVRYDDPVPKPTTRRRKPRKARR